MAKIDKQIARNIKEEKYDDIPAKTARDDKAKHAHKYPEKIRENVANYEKQVGYTAKAKEKAVKRLEELTEKNLETRISKRRKARNAYKKLLNESVIAEHESATNDLVLGE